MKWAVMHMGCLAASKIQKLTGGLGKLSTDALLVFLTPIYKVRQEVLIDVRKIHSCLFKLAERP